MAQQQEPHAERPQRGGLRRLLSLPLIIVVAGAVLGAVAIPALQVAQAAVTTVGDELLSVPPLPTADTPAQRSVMFAADGSQLGVLAGTQNRVLVSLDEIPEELQHAVIATEDANFYEHGGINQRAIMRAALENLTAGGIEQGGSTITQQYVKNAFLTPKQTLQRKVKEALYAVRLEKRLSKDEILKRYLNITYLGHGAYGVEAASQFYFGKHVGEISLPQAALLAGMIRSPVSLDPIDHPVDARKRRNVVLAQMAAQGYISQQEASQAQDVPVKTTLNPTPLPPPRYPFFVEYVKKQLLDMPQLGDTRQDRVEALFSGGLRVYTTLHPGKQKLARQTIEQELPDPKQDPMSAIVSVVPQSGEIVTMATGPEDFGSCDKGEENCEVTKVNPIAPGMGGSGRQAGSSFKPILDVTALEQGIPTSWHTNTDSGQAVEGCGAPGKTWHPHNYAPGEGGTTDMVTGLTESNNVYHAKLIAKVGPRNVAEMAKKLGVGEVPPVCAISLGAASVYPLQMVTAYATFANGGVRCDPYAITKITDATGKVLYQHEPHCERVLSQKTADTITSLLRNVVRHGTGRGAQIGRDIAGKTGTTDDWRDAWFIGYAPQLATATWVGYDTPKPMIGMLGYAHVAGGTVPADIWSTYMRQAMSVYPKKDLPWVHLDEYTPPPPPPPPAPKPKPKPKPKPEPKPKPKPEPKPKDGGGGGGGGGGGQDQTAAGGTGGTSSDASPAPSGSG